MDDGDAIARCLGGEPGAFRHLVERYEREAFAHALAITACRDTARDAVQEAFVDAFSHLDRFDRSRRFYPWLYTLLRNRCFKQLAAKRPVAGLVANDLIEPSRDPGDESPDLEKALLSLEPEERELVLLKHLDGLTYGELAERLGIPAGTVMSRLFHARRKLQARLGPAYGEPR